MNVDMFAKYDQAEAAINEALAHVGLGAIAIKIRKGLVLNKETIAAVVYFETAYHARCALRPLAHLGRVHLGRTVATTRVRHCSLSLSLCMYISEYIYIYIHIYNYIYNF